MNTVKIDWQKLYQDAIALLRKQSDIVHSLIVDLEKAHEDMKEALEGKPVYILILSMKDSGKFIWAMPFSTLDGAMEYAQGYSGGRLRSGGWTISSAGWHADLDVTSFTIVIKEIRK